MPKPFVAHNTGKVEWYTPQRVLDPVREVLGGIDLDPCAAPSPADRALVGAAMHYTAADDALAPGRSWEARSLFCNPPYAARVIDRWASRFLSAVEGGEAEAAIWLSNNATETRWCQRILSGGRAACFPAARIRFAGPGGRRGPGPLQGQIVVYFGPRHDAFAQAFAGLGAVLRGGAGRPDPQGRLFR